MTNFRGRGSLSASKRENAGADFVILSQSSSSSSDRTNSSCGFGKIVSTPMSAAEDCLAAPGRPVQGSAWGRRFLRRWGRPSRYRALPRGWRSVEVLSTGGCRRTSWLRARCCRLQDFVTEDDVAKGAVDEEFVLEYLFVEDEVREVDEWAKAKRTRSGSAIATREVPSGIRASGKLGM